MKARDEAEAHRHMEIARQQSNLSGWAREWQRSKAAQLTQMYEAWDEPRPMRVLELGVGDLTHLRQWPAFVKPGGIEYTGVDFLEEVIAAARKEFPHHAWLHADFSSVAGGKVFHCDRRWDVVLLLDVLYHIPTNELHDAVLDFAFERADVWVMLTHATDQTQRFDAATRPGQGGFCWFPRELVIPQRFGDFGVVYSEDADTPQRQELLVLEKL